VSEFLQSLEPMMREYLPRQAGLPERYARAASLAQEASEQACVQAARALAAAGERGAAWDRAAALLAWAELARWLVHREPGVLLSRPGMDLAFPEPALASIRALAARSKGPEAEEERFRAALAPLIPEAANAASPELPLALADCLMLHSAATGRLASASSLHSRLKRTQLGPLPPAPQGAEPPAGPAEVPETVLRDPTLPITLRTAPTLLILPLYALAARLDPNGNSPGAHYGLYCARLLVDEAGAHAMPEEWLARHPSNAAFLLERARTELHVKRDAATALASIASAARRRLERPVFLSLPPELRPAWRTSRHARLPGPEFLLRYDSLFQLIDVQAAALKKEGKSNLPLLTVRFRLSELLIESNYLPDVFQGISQAGRSLGILRSKATAEEHRAQAEVYAARLAEAARRAPGELARLVITRHGIRAQRQAEAILEPGPTPHITVELNGLSGSF
jgi:hypothetical protein